MTGAVYPLSPPPRVPGPLEGIGVIVTRPQRQAAVFAAKILQFLTASDERRLGEYEGISWWQFLDGDLYSPKFQRQLRAVPRTMVAMDPQRGSARTIGVASMQLILDYATSGVNNDRTMGGPTSEMWFDPWIAHLTALGVQLHVGTAIDSLEMTGNAIDLAEIAREQILLELPQQFFCKDDCRGLCEKCGRNLNLKDCDCEDDEIDPRWAALKNLN